MACQVARVVLPARPRALSTLRWCVSADFVRLRWGSGVLALRLW
jgi:hypothetical protein